MCSDPPTESDPPVDEAFAPRPGSDGTQPSAEASRSEIAKPTGEFWRGAQFVFFSLMIVVGIYLWWRGASPEPDMPSVDGLDPAIVNVLRNCEEAVRRYPRSGPAWGQLGVALLVYEFKDDAKASFEQAERFDGNDPRWPYFHGMSLLPDSTDQAVEKLQHAVKLYSDETSAPRLRLANVLTELKRYDEAIKHYEFVEERWPGDAAAALGIGKIALLRGDDELATKRLMNAVESPFTARAAHQLLLIAHRNRGEAEVVESLEAKLTTLPPDRPMRDPFVEEASKLRAGLRAWVDYAALLVRQGRVEEAKPLASRAIEQYPESTDAWMLMARIHLAEKDGEKALQAAKQAVELTPEAVEPHMQIGVTYLALGSVNDAIASFRRVTELQPTLSEPHHNLGLCYVAIQQWDKAISSFRESTRINPDFIDAYLGLADSLARTGDTDNAKAAVDRAMELNPRDPRAHRIVAIYKLDDVAMPSATSE